jgi:hypothetical protein
MYLEHFLKRDPESNTHVIFDEIDSMLGVNSFSLIDDKEINMTKAIFNASLMRSWKSVIGFSGTISPSTLSTIRTELKDPMCIDIPSLRLNGSNNRIAKVVKIDKDSDLCDAISNRIKELLDLSSNFIIVFKDLKDLRTFQQDPTCIEITKAKSCIAFDNFN